MCRNPSFIIKAILNITVFCYIIKYLLGKLRRPRRNNAANAPTCAAPLRRNVYGVCIYNHHSLNAVHSPVPWDSFQFSLLFCSSWLFLLSNEIEMCPISGRTRSDRRCKLTSLRESSLLFPNSVDSVGSMWYQSKHWAHQINPVSLGLDAGFRFTQSGITLQLKKKRSR